MKKRMEGEYVSMMTNYEAYHFNRGFIWGTSFRSTKKEREKLYSFNEKCINNKKA